ncbi:hypothetical protein SAMN05216428_103173 [Nitrosospira sp. Nsp11]|uniref:hypothetical protein n=1 Tax=unclassified Nitrosospira TaxID=2609267 RepID=UPI00088248DF|nr:MULTISPECIES: hypothetical protein [unclassified Nitrosospira]SDA13547.1 hypothetical protein SAMN05216315_10482 [Nitrosospira sp. Nsp18]SHL54835.1 hypothetical protein SAMN05216428_103173 [Nitrosospira sp. Nsp11]
MHKLLLISISLLAIVLLALAAAFSLAIEDHPRIDRQVILTPEHIGRAKQIIDAHRYWVRPGMLAAANIASSDVDLAANYLAHRFGKGSAQVILADGNAVIRLSLPMAIIPINGYINLAASVMEEDGKPQLQSVQIGKLMLPDVLTQILALQFVDWLRQSAEYKAGLDLLKWVKLSRNELGIVYRWAGGFSKGMRASIIDKQERERLLHYQSLLAANSVCNEAVMPLSQILPPLVRVAAARSVNGDALAENRAVILVVAFHVLGVSLKRILPEAPNWPRSVPQSITLDGRDDFAKHFMASAAIAAYADTMLSDAIGLYKEIEDSVHGSGFSFNDIAADRAGTKFGEKAVISEASAQQLQRQVVSGLKDADLMPLWSDLPEFMSEMEFKQRFGGIDAPAYQRMMQKIEQRVAALRVLQ